MLLDGTHGIDVLIVKIRTCLCLVKLVVYCPGIGREIENSAVRAVFGFKLGYALIAAVRLGCNIRCKRVLCLCAIKLYFVVREKIGYLCNVLVSCLVDKSLCIGSDI